MRLSPLHVFCFIILTLCAGVVAHAGVLKGIIRDSKGETLPFATVFVQGTTTGTAANAAGVYQLQLAPGTYQITCQYIGYKQSVTTITIAGNETLEHAFTLQEQSLEMREVVVKGGGEDPAYAIIRKAIGKRPFHLKQVKAFQTSIYLKGVLRTRETPDRVLGQKVEKGDMGLDSLGKGVLYLCEEVADYYAQEPDKERTVIHSVRESGDPNGLGFSQLPEVITFYENNVNVMDQINPRGFVSPIADNALGFYKYKLQGEFRENRQIIYKIRVTPKRQYEPVFSGYIYIVDDDWAIHSLSLTTTAKSNMEFLDTLRLDQVFLPLKHDTWVIKSQLFYPVLNILGFGITGNFVTVYDNQKVNEPVPDTIFNKKIVSVYDKTANKKDTGYWEEVRPIPLEADETRDYHIKDSMLRHTVDPHISDSLRHRSNRIKLMDVFLNGKTIQGKAHGSAFSFNGLLFAVNYNTVEGVNVAPHFSYRRNLDTGKTLQVRLGLRYGFGNTHFNAMTGITYTRNDREWRGRNWAVGMEGGKYVFQYNPENPVSPLLNTFSTLFYNQNYLKLYERWDGALTFRRSGGNGFKWNARLNYQKRMPLDNNTGYTWAKGSLGPLTDNLPAELKSYHWEPHSAMLVHLALSYQPGYTYVLYPDYKMPQSGNAPTFSFQYDKGIPGILGSKTDFDQWRAGMTGTLRLKLFGTVSYNLATGGFLRKEYVGLPDLKHLYGNQFALAAPYLRSFQLAPYYRYSNTDDLYGEVHVEYNLFGLLTNKIPLLRQAKWYFILGNNTYYSGSDRYYTEAVLSIDNLGYKLYRFLRLDIVQSWDAQGRSATGIRAGFRLGGLVSIGSSSSESGEW